MPRNIQMNDMQVALIARALRLVQDDSIFTADEREELALLAGCADATVSDPDPTVIHGWCI